MCTGGRDMLPSPGYNVHEDFQKWKETFAAVSAENVAQLQQHSANASADSHANALQKAAIYVQ